MENKPQGRKVTAEGTGRKFGKKGEAVGTGPVNNMGNYEDRPATEAKQPEKPLQSAMGGAKGTSSRPASARESSRPAAARETVRPGSAQRSPSGQRPAEAQQNPSQQHRASGLGLLSSLGAHQSSSQGSSSQSQGSGGMLGGLLGGNNKIILIVLVLAIAVFGMRYCGKTGDEETSSNPVTDLLSLFMGSSGNTVYDFNSSQASVPSSSSGYNSGITRSTLNTKVSKPKYTQFTKDDPSTTVTILVYMCGSDLESRSGMGTADLREMANAKFGENVKLIVYTGGSSRWKNNVVGSGNEIYRLSDGKMERLKSDGSASMTDPATLRGFLDYGFANYPSDRMCLIMWDHGGGSVSGFGYDERKGRGQSMSLSQIRKALNGYERRFDFIGFDACLMATVENALMLSPYADYLIASEETEPGVGWYYTDWLNALGKNPGMDTIYLGQKIADDFVDKCATQCRGQATTLSVVDLGELKKTLPKALAGFSTDTTQMIRKEYKKVSKARGSAREFAQSSRIDQIDLVDFAKKLNTDESTELAKVLLSAVKYNVTNGMKDKEGKTTANGLSIYFPYQQAGKVKNAVNALNGIGMDTEYTRCIQEFASLESSGQAAAAGQYFTNQSTALPGLSDMLNGGSGYSGFYGEDLSSLLGDMLGSGDLLFGRELTAEDMGAYVTYVTANHIDDSLLRWNGNRITLPAEQADTVNDTALNVFVRYEDGWIDLGVDDINYKWEGNNTLIHTYAGEWLHFEDIPVAYYYLYKVENGAESVGYVPALLTRDGKDMQVKLIVSLKGSKGEIIGVQLVYGDDEAEGKNMIDYREGDTLTFIYEHYDKDWQLDNTFTMDGFSLPYRSDMTITYRTLGDKENIRASFCIWDIYNQKHWTQALN